VLIAAVFETATGRLTHKQYLGLHRKWRANKEARRDMAAIELVSIAMSADSEGKASRVTGPAFLGSTAAQSIEDSMAG